MTSAKAYKKFLIKLNKNDTNAKVKVNKGEFVLIYNEQKLKWLTLAIDKYESTDESFDIADVFVEGAELKKVKNYTDKTVYDLPEDFYRFVTSTSQASQAGCTKNLYNWPFKPRNKNNVMMDENNNPSFEFEETPVLVVKK